MSPTLAGRFFTPEPLGKPHWERIWAEADLGALVAVYRVKNLSSVTSWVTQTRSEKLEIAAMYKLLSL